MIRRPRPKSAVLLVVVLAVGGGCALPEDKAPPAPASAPVARGGSLTVGISAPGGVDPASFLDPSALLVGSVLCETLVTLDPVTGEVKPGLAKKWRVTDGGARIILQLRKDAVFHDGRKVRSADVVEALRRLADPESGSGAADLMEGVAGLDRFRAEIEEGLPAPALSGLRVIEPYSFEIFLRPANPDFVRVLAHPATAPVSKAAYDRDGEAAEAHPQCAGPYRLESPFRLGASEIVLKRFDRYYGRNTTFTAGGAGHVDELRFRLYADEPAVVAAWERGEVDIAPVPSPMSPEVRQRHGERAVIGDSPAVEFIVLPHGEASPLEARVRTALSLALDRQALVSAAYGDAHRPATGFIPLPLTTPLTVGAQTSSAKPVRYGCDNVPVAGDRERARRLLAGPLGDIPGEGAPQPTAAPASVSAPPSVKLYFNDESTHRRLAEGVAAQWREVLGLDVQPTPLGWEEFRAKTSGDGALPGAALGIDGMFRMSYSPRYSSVQAFLKPLFHSNADPRVNRARYASSAFDDALSEDTQPVVNEQERQVQYKKLEELLCREMPIIPVAFGRRTFLVRERVTPARKSGEVLDREALPILRDLAVTP